MDSPYRIEIVSAEELQATLNRLHSEYFRVRQLFQRPAPPYDYTIFAEFEKSRHRAEPSIISTPELSVEQIMKKYGVSRSRAYEIKKSGRVL